MKLPVLLLLIVFALAPQLTGCGGSSGGGPPDPGEPWYTIRGIAFDRPLVEGALYDSTTVPARWWDGNIGFRCAKDP